MSEPNKRDQKIKEEIDLAFYRRETYGEMSHSEVLDIIASYREEIEAKKTVPMAMLIDCWHAKTCLDEIPEIVRRYGYEVTE